MTDERDHWHVFKCDDCGGWVAQYRSHAAGALPSQHGPFTSKRVANAFVDEAVKAREGEI